MTYSRHRRESEDEHYSSGGYRGRRSDGGHYNRQSNNNNSNSNRSWSHNQHQQPNNNAQQGGDGSADLQSQRAYFTYGDRQQYQDSMYHANRGGTYRGGAGNYTMHYAPNGANQYYHQHGGTPPSNSPQQHPSTPTSTATQRIVKVETVGNTTHTYRSNIPYRRLAESPPPVVVGVGERTPHHSNGSTPNLGPISDGSTTSYYNSGVNICRHFLNGNCNRGAMCRFVHPEKHHVVVRTTRTPNAFHPPPPLSPSGMTDEPGEILEDFSLPPASLSFHSVCVSPQAPPAPVPSPQRHDPYARGDMPPMSFNEREVGEGEVSSPEGGEFFHQRAGTEVFEDDRPEKNGNGHLYTNHTTTHHEPYRWAVIRNLHQSEQVFMEDGEQQQQQQQQQDDEAEPIEEEEPFEEAQDAEAAEGEALKALW